MIIIIIIIIISIEDLSVADLLLHLARLAGVPPEHEEPRGEAIQPVDDSCDSLYDSLVTAYLWMVRRFLRLYSLARMKTTVLWR